MNATTAISALATLTFASSVLAQQEAMEATVDPAIRESFIEEVRSRTKITTKQIVDLNVDKCFSGDLHAADIHNQRKKSHIVTFGKREALYLVNGEKATLVTEPGTNKEMPSLLGLVNPEFRLQTEEDEEALTKAMKALFESTFQADTKPHFIRKGNQWSLVTHEFFEDPAGFVFETDADGKITKISRSLKISRD